MWMWLGVFVFLLFTYFWIHWLLLSFAIAKIFSMKYSLKAINFNVFRRQIFFSLFSLVIIDFHLILCCPRESLLTFQVLYVQVNDKNRKTKFVKKINRNHVCQPLKQYKVRVTKVKCLCLSIYWSFSYPWDEKIVW